MAKQRVGILTGGGDCPGLNAVIRAVTKSAQRTLGLEVMGFRDGFEGMVKNDHLLLDDRAVSGIIARGGTILGCSNRHNPFHYVDKPTDKPTDRSADVLRHYKEHKLTALFCIGGDGTLSVGHQFGALGLKIICIPKTIDNDLEGTDVTFGHDSAVRNAVDAIDKIHDTAESHHRIMVVETMGRYSGWIALRAGIAAGGDAILIPEIPYDIKKVAAALQQRSKTGKRFSIVVTAEGAVPRGGAMTVQRTVQGSHDPIRLGGVSHKIAHDLEERTGIECRAIILGHVQRGGSPSAFDRVLCTRYGAHAVELLATKKFGHMVALHGNRMTSIPMEHAARKNRLVDVDGELVHAARAVGTAFGDE